MAVTFATGFEAQQAATDNITLNSASITVSGTPRSGIARCNVSAPASSGVWIDVPAANYMHFGVNFSSFNLPTDRLIFGSTASGTINVRLAALSSALSVYVGTTLIGITANLVPTTGTWWWLGIRQVTGTNVAFLQINGVDAVIGTATVTATSGKIGPSNFEASTIGMFVDDVVCETAGFLAPSKVDIALPISDNTVTAVTAGAGGTTNLWDAVNNAPPAGVASASETNTTNIKYPASATESYIANLETYTTLGVGASDTIIAVQSVIRHGEDIATGTKNGVLGAVSNPTISDSLAFVFGGDAGAHGAETSSPLWASKFGTLTANAAGLSVTLGTSPTLAVTRASETRVGCVDYMGLLVVWTPAVVTTPVDPIRQDNSSTLFPSILQAVNRGASF